MSSDREKHESLEAERDFLLRSLDDLDNERAAGNIDDATYARLHADYTARAAAVLRQLRDGLDLAPTVARPVTRRRQVLTLGVIAVFALTSAGLLVQSVRQRGPGGSLTGNNPNTTVPAKQREATLVAAVAQHPKDYAARIALARYYLGTDLRKAVAAYDTAAQLDPTQPEPLAYGAWIRAIAARQLKPGNRDRTLLLKTAFDRFNQAIKIGPGYADTFVYRAIVWLQLGNPKRAIPDFQRFLQLAPQDHPQRAMVLGALAQAEAAVNAGSATTASPTTPTTTR
ncbi:MAG: cytochrome c biosis factor [Actinomycetia bacterium]|nr:cytochrome c biosis factor [Actinomycetes bacterium]